ncbi:hypothetical protein XENTR_v10005394 [Xenopus tropicalis]|nr:hypothetical protein XENTR_v10005394 [Xenopus tropicalis]
MAILESSIRALTSRGYRNLRSSISGRAFSFSENLSNATDVPPNPGDIKGCVCSTMTLRTPVGVKPCLRTSRHFSVR